MKSVCAFCYKETNETAHDCPEMRKQINNHYGFVKESIIHISVEEYYSLCKKDQLKLKSIIHKLGGELDV